MHWATNAFHILCKGGPVMVPLIGCSIISLAVMLERYLSLRHAAGDPQTLMKRLENCLALGKFTEAAKMCDSEGTPLGEMLSAGLRCPDPRHADKCMEEHALKALPSLRKRLNILDTIITIAPLLGLLGTVTGMIRSFAVMSTKTGLNTPTVITGGVAEALIATATGLAIAIVTLVGYNFLIEKARGVESDLEVYGTHLSNILSSGAEEQHASKAMGA